MGRVIFQVKVICLFLCFTLGSEAKIKLPAFLSDGMVLQREQNIRIWGTADPGEQVVVSFLKKRYNTEADADGYWQVTLPPTKAGGPYTMQINELEVGNILIGDVYLCSGQSNMELPVSRVTDMFREEVSGYKNPMIRYIKVPMNYNFQAPLNDILPETWKELTSENVMQYSALCYFFAKEMYASNNIPVGIINSSVGGSPIEAWISEEGLKPFPKYLNQKELYPSEEIVAEIRRADHKRSQRWREVLYANDSGLHESVKWFDPAYNDSDWKTIHLFDPSWNNNGVSPVNGSHWFRKEVDITAVQAGKPAVLRLGCIVDADSVFVNGSLVGAVSYQYPPRIYPIPEGLLNVGKNNITIRLMSNSGRPHFVHGKPYKIVMDDDEINLEENWKYKLGTAMPALPGGTTFQYIPAGLYNAMIAPLIGYSFKSAIWYQGESNTGRYNEYFDLCKAMIADWRSVFGRPDLPFVIVQLPNFMETGKHPVESDWAELRDVQFKLAQSIPYVGLSVNIDLGEWNDVHPLNKKDVAHRIALQVKKLTQNNRTVIADGPLYKAMRIEGNAIILSFSEGTDDIMPVDELKGFAIAGPDGKYKWAKAKIDKNTVRVWNDEIPNPVAARYAWANNPEDANLKNRDGLPASPFQTQQAPRQISPLTIKH